jgi:hypothetical protein
VYRLARTTFLSRPVFIFNAKTYNKSVFFIRRMELMGRKLKQNGEVRLQEVKQGITNHRDKMRDLLLGEDKVTPKLIQKLKEAELLEKEKELKTKKTFNNLTDKSTQKTSRTICFRCVIEGHIVTECKTHPRKQMNEIVKDCTEISLI